jgi:hypothetical protein
MRNEGLTVPKFFVTFTNDYDVSDCSIYKLPAHAL